MKSIEEQIEDYIKNKISKLNLRYFCKNEPVNKEIDTALKNGLSKSGGSGGNYPDIKLLVKDTPVMIEIKGKTEDFMKVNIKNPGRLLMDFKTIPKYAVNGACHYANIIVSGSNYNKCLAIGVTGNKAPTGDLVLYLGAYLIERDKEPRKLDMKSIEDLSMAEKFI